MLLTAGYLLSPPNFLSFLTGNEGNGAVGSTACNGREQSSVDEPQC